MALPPLLDCRGNECDGAARARVPSIRFNNTSTKLATSSDAERSRCRSGNTRAAELGAMAQITLLLSREYFTSM
jgi:hypothetical protein